MRNTKKNWKVGGLVGLLLLSLGLSSFNSRFGGDVYRVYVNNKLVLEEFVYKNKEVKSISLEGASLGDQLQVVYLHCGVVGKSREIEVRASGGKVMKEWRYRDDTNKDARMGVSVRELVALQKANGSAELELVYSSKELPGGRELAKLNVGSLAKVAP